MLCLLYLLDLLYLLYLLDLLYLFYSTDSTSAYSSSKPVWTHCHEVHVRYTDPPGPPPQPSSTSP